MDDYDEILAKAQQMRKEGATLQQVAIALPIRLGDLMALGKLKPREDRSLPNADHRNQ